MKKITLIEVYKEIREEGGRLTKIRKKILEIFFKKTCLISNQELLKKLNQANLYPNRSTIFREIIFLIKKKWIKKFHLLGNDYYEIVDSHHHHLICLVCKFITKLEMDDNHLKKHEEQIKNLNNFKLVDHLLEFYGYCKKCQI